MRQLISGIAERGDANLTVIFGKDPISRMLVQVRGNDAKDEKATAFTVAREILARLK